MVALMIHRIMYGHFRKLPPITVIFASRTTHDQGAELHSLHRVGFYETCQNPFVTEVARM